MNLSRVKPETVKIDDIGLMDVKVYESMLCVISQNGNGYVSVYDKNTMSYMGRYITQGRGPGEAMFTPFF